VTLRTAIAALRNLPRLRLQEEYTRVFDLNPATCLNLTYHKWGDSPERAAGLAKLNQLYLDAGFEWVGGELPDFLPLVLEFLALAPKEAGVLITGQFREQIEILGSRLDSLQSTYAGILRALREAISM
jgi:nitrate reductase delta subunit